MKFQDGDIADYASGDIADFGSGDIYDYGSGDIADFGSGDIADFGSGVFLDLESGHFIGFGSGDIADFGSGDFADFGSGDILDFAIRLRTPGARLRARHRTGTCGSVRAHDVRRRRRWRLHGRCAGHAAVSPERSPLVGSHVRRVFRYEIARKRGNATSAYSYATVGTSTTPDFVDLEELPNGVEFTYRVRAEFDDVTPHAFSEFSRPRTITAVNNAPAAVANSYTTPKSVTLNIAAPGVLGNDTDVDSAAGFAEGGAASADRRAAR